VTRRAAIAALLAPAALRARQTTFDFHSGLWLNLHHVLYNQSAGKRDNRAPDLSPLTPAETSLWNAALDYYDRNLSTRELLDPEMIRIRDPLADAADRSSLAESSVPPALRQLLENVMPAYYAHWWPAHNTKNHEWIAHVTELLDRYESALKPEFAHAFATRWPRSPMRVEMSYYTTGASAYTSILPTTITVSSWSRRNLGPAALETIFHEAGHALIPKVRDEIDRAARKRGKPLRHPDLWHAVQFYTTGELVRQHLPALTPYAVQYGMWESQWPGVLPVLEANWKPYLDRMARFQDAIAQIVTHL
jgi:hypothetical protein